MKKTSTNLVDEHLRSVENMQEASTDEFFYTRLKAKLEERNARTGWQLPIRPAWVLGILLMLLAANGMMLSQQFRSTRKVNTTSSSLQTFAESYDQSVSSY
jgi:hypothetical protein